MSETKATASFPFFSILFLVLMTLKLTGTIGTSWFWISACLWLPLLVGITLLLIGVLIAIVRY